MIRHVLSGIIGALVAGVTIFAIIFFWKNPFRQGEISFTTPSGASMTLNVSNSNDIAELIRAALQTENSAFMMTNSLLSIIKGLKPGCILVEELCNLVERREPPFCANSFPVKLVYDPKMPIGIAAACENSRFLAKNIRVYPIDDNGGGIPTNALGFFVDSRMAFSCRKGGEILRVNSEKVEEFNRRNRKVMAKRTY